MAQSDASIVIDLSLNDMTDDMWSKFKDKAKSAGKDGHKEFKDSFGNDPVVAKLEAKANKSGVTNFREMLNDLPKKKQTELLAKAESSKVVDFEQLLNKMPHKTVTKMEVSDHATTPIKNIKREADETNRGMHSLRDGVKGALGAGLIMAGTSALVGGLKDATKAGMEYNKQQDTMRTVWHSLTEEVPKDGKSVLDFIDKTSQNSIYAAGDIDKMAQSFYHVKGNVADTKRWTDDFVALGSTMHMTGGQVSEAAEMFAKMQATGKAGADDIAIMVNRFPMFAEALEKSSGKSMKQIYELSSQGKLQASTLADAMDSLGKKYKNGTEEAMGSFQGMSMFISSRWSKLWGDITKTSFNMSKDQSKILRDMLSDDAMSKYAAGIGNAIGGIINVFSGVLKFISEHQKEILGILGTVVSVLTNSFKIAAAVLSGVFDTVFTVLGTVADAISGISKALFGTKDSVNPLAKAFEWLASQTEALKILGGVIGTIAIGFGAYKLAVMAITGVTKAWAGAQALLNLALSANPIGLIIIAIGALVAGIIVLYKKCKPFRDFVDGMGRWISKAFGAVIDFFKNDWKQILVFIVNPFAGIGALLYKHFKPFRDVVDSTVKFVKDAFNGFVGFFAGIFKAIGKAVGAVASAIWKGLQPVVKIFETVFNVIKSVITVAFKIIVGIIGVALLLIVGAVKGMWKAVKFIFDGLVIFFKKVVAPVFTFLAKVVSGAFNAIVDGVKWLWKMISSYINFVIKTFQMLWNKVVAIFNAISKAIHSVIDPVFKWLGDVVKTAVNNMVTNFTNMWHWVSDIFTNLYKSLKKIVTDMFEWIWNFIKPYIDKIVKIFQGFWDSVCDIFNGLWKSAKNIFTGLFDWLGGFVSKALDNIANNFSNVWKSVSDGFKAFWDGLKKLAAGGINIVIKPINEGIGFINKLISWFGGGKDTIGKLDEVHFATGTGALGGARRPITKPTIGILNDGAILPETGHNKEMVVRNNGAMQLVQGMNTKVLLNSGDEVLNARETAELMSGMGHAHFASGTGWWDSIKDGASDLYDGAKDVASDAWDGTKKVAGDVYDGAKSGVKFVSDKVVDGYDWVADKAGHIKDMIDFIGKAVAHPIDTLKDYFNPKNESKGDIVHSITDGFIKKPVKQAQDWWTQVWKMADGEANGSNAEGDDYDYKSHAKDDGADPWGYYFRECVSFVANRLKHMGVPEYLFSHLGNGSDWVNSKARHTSEPEPGMVAVYGPGSPFSSNHVAMVSDVKGDTISGEEYNFGENGQYNKYSGRSKKDVTTFLDFGKRLLGIGGKKETGGLAGFVGNQLGDMMKWIKKFVSPKSSASSGSSGDVQSWSNDVKKALTANGLSTSSDMVQKVLRQIQTESGGNAGVTQQIQDINSGGNEAQGLMQVIPSTFNAYKHSGHDNIKNGYDNLLAALAYAKSRYGENLNGLGEGHGYADGGRTNQKGVVGEVAGQPEWVTNPNRNSADATIEGAIFETADKQPNSMAAKLAQVINSAKASSRSAQANKPQQLSNSRSISKNAMSNGSDVSGDVEISLNIDGQKIAEATFSKLQVMQNNKIQATAVRNGGTIQYGF